jgi:hypothetical protein
MDEPDRDRVEVVELLAALLAGHDQSGLLELLQMLHHPNRVIEKRPSSSLRLWPSRTSSPSSRLLRVASASALKIASTPH